jgi:hypothetical protein
MVVLAKLPAAFVLALLRFYRAAISPMLGPRCRFHPSCSAFASACVHDHGVVRGGLLTLGRLSRCHPWHPGGIDLPPPRRLAPTGSSRAERGPQ